VFAALTGLIVLGQSLELDDWLAIAAIVTSNAVSVSISGQARGPGQRSGRTTTTTNDTDMRGGTARRRRAQPDAPDRPDMRCYQRERWKPPGRRIAAGPCAGAMALGAVLAMRVASPARLAGARAGAIAGQRGVRELALI
jgi:hypothetical protein